MDKMKQRESMGNNKLKRRPRREERIGVGCSSDEEGKVGAQMELFEELQVKLQLLEEDTRIMKKAVFGFVKERNLLMSEIAQQFRVVEGRHSTLVSGDGSLGLASILDHRKDISRRIPLVTRDLRVNLDASQNP